jgi:hypothetical protein
MANLQIFIKGVLMSLFTIVVLWFPINGFTEADENASKTPLTFLSR